VNKLGISSDTGGRVRHTAASRNLLEYLTAAELSICAYNIN